MDLMVAPITPPWIFRFSGLAYDLFGMDGNLRLTNSDNFVCSLVYLYICSRLGIPLKQSGNISLNCNVLLAPFIEVIYIFVNL